MKPLSHGSRRLIWDRVARLYDILFAFAAHLDRRIMEEHLGELALPPQARVLDIGCGTGSLAMWLWSLGFSVWAVDSSPAMIRRARRRFIGPPRHSGGARPEKNLTFLVADVLDGLGFAEGAFDLVYCSHVVHGLESSRRIAFLEEAKRVSRGKVVVLDYPPYPGPRGPDAALTRFVEILEGSQFRSFIVRGEGEMRSVFPSVSVIPAHPSIALYLCAPGLTR